MKSTENEKRTCLHPDSECKDLLKNYFRPTNWLEDMYKKQRDFQVFLASKGGDYQPPSDAIPVIPSHIDIACYHQLCMGMEFNELADAIRDGRHLLEVQFEYADILCFLMNIGIYSGASLTVDTCETAPQTVDILQQSLKYIDILPYKKWKTYCTEDFKPCQDRDLTFTRLLNDAIRTIVHELDIDFDRLYNLFVSKLSENYARQTDVSKGYTNANN